jgi:hypothetical protein
MIQLLKDLQQLSFRFQVLLLLHLAYVLQMQHPLLQAQEYILLLLLLLFHL